MIFYFSIVLVHFVFCYLNFIVLFPCLIKDCHILFIIIEFRLGSDISSSVVYSLSFPPPKGSVTGCDSSFEGGWMIFHLRLFNSILFSVN